MRDASNSESRKMAVIKPTAFGLMRLMESLMREPGFQLLARLRPSLVVPADRIDIREEWPELLYEEWVSVQGDNLVLEFPEI